MQEFPQLWLTRLNQLVQIVRRQKGWDEVSALVVPPQQSTGAPLLRLQMGGTLEFVPLSRHAVEQMMLTGQEQPVAIEVKQAFLRVVKVTQRREQRRSSR